MQNIWCAIPMKGSFDPQRGYNPQVESGWSRVRPRNCVGCMSLTPSWCQHRNTREALWSCILFSSSALKNAINCILYRLPVYSWWWSLTSCNLTSEHSHCLKLESCTTEQPPPPCYPALGKLWSSLLFCPFQAFHVNRPRCLFFCVWTSRNFLMVTVWWCFVLFPADRDSTAWRDCFLLSLTVK